MAGDCVSCHMRTGGTSDIPHVSFTDHWIRRDPPPSKAGVADDVVGGAELRRDTPFRLVNLVAQGDVPPSRAEADVTLALATLSLYETAHRLPAYLPEIAARLRRGLGAGVERTDARVGLGRALFEMDSLASAQRVLEDAVARDEGRAVRLAVAGRGAGRPRAPRPGRPTRSAAPRRWRPG